MNRHSKAVRTASIEGGSSRRAISLALLSLVALLALVFAASASALSQRPFKGDFGSVEQPSFGAASGVAVDQASGDVLIADNSGETIRRFHADGTPAPFAALGTNTIDGAEANGKPCAEEPASCDKTPQNGIHVPPFELSEEFQIAIDESGGATDGDIYVTQKSSQLVDIFAEDGRYLGQLTEAGVHAWQGGGPKGVAVDSSGAVYVSNGGEQISKFIPTANPVVNTDLAVNLLLPMRGNDQHNEPLGRGTPYSLALGTGPTTGSLFVAAQVGSCIGFACAGYNSILQLDKETGESIAEFDIDPPHLNENGQFTSRDKVRGFVAVSPSTGNVLDGTGSEFEVPAGSEPVRVARLIPSKGPEGLRGVPAINSANEVIAPEGSAASVYGVPATVPTVTTEPASEVTGTKATLTGTVNPTGLPVTECFFEYGETIAYGHKEPCEGSIPTDSSPHPVRLDLSGLEPNSHTYHFRLIAFNANGQEETADRTLTTANTVVAEAASPIGSTTATLNGTVRPEGSGYSECFFEYGLSSNTSFEGKVNCAPSAAAIAADFSPHAVKAALTGLHKNANYRFRLVATNNLGTLKSEEVTFTTNGLAQISEVQASNADQSSFALEAKINPSGSGTSYRFEWGATTAYGNVTPAEFEPYIGSGTEPVQVKSRLSGLPTGTAYHYRLVASNGFGTARSADHVAETLNSCGLANGRCFELVSRSEAGPVAIPGESNAHIEMHYQAATAGPGALAYPVESGYPEATKGADVLYRATRGSNGWLSTQLSAPIIAPNEREVVSVSSATLFLSNDLSCGFLESWQPLTADPSMRLQYEVGGSNLYRLNPDGSYTGVSYLAPENPSEGTYSVAFASQDCSKVVFSTSHTYPGIPGAGQFRLYEWDEGTLRNAGVVPGPSGEVVAAARAGGQENVSFQNTLNAVSEDGSRVFFTAQRRTSPNSEEIGKQALFVREDGTVSRDLSQSETSIPDEGAEYQWATADGSKVFFTANAGLTDESNSEGTDLYEYDLETEELTDRSVAAAEGGAQVVGFVGAAKDGSRVYFASRNQLVPGRGNSRDQNLSANSYSIYGETGDQIDFVGTIKASDRNTALVADETSRTATVSPDGRYLVFESAAKVTGYENGGVIEAYLYDAQGGSRGTICVSCRQDGQPSVAPVTGYSVLPRADYLYNKLHPPLFLTEKDGEARVFFSSPDVLAPGATEGQNNIYEWAHDQVFRLASALKGSQSPFPFAGAYATFGGASDDGSDVYIVTPETLTWEDGDERPSAYDARVGGGRPEPPAPPAGCNATVEGSCQGAAQGGPAVPGAASATFTGPGNEKQTQAKKKKKAHKKKSKKPVKKKQKKGSGKRARHANGNGRTGK